MRAIRLAAVALVLLLLLALALVTKSRTESLKLDRDIADERNAAAGPREGTKKRDFARHPRPSATVFEDARPDPAAPPHPFVPYLSAKAATLQKLGEVIVDLDAADTVLAVLLAAISDRIGMPIYLDCPADQAAREISFTIKGLAAAHVLRLLVQQYGCRMVISENGEIWVVSREEGAPSHEPVYMPQLNALLKMSRTVLDERLPPPYAEEEQALLAALRNTRLSVNFSQTPLPDAAAWLSENARINIMIDRRSITEELMNTPITAGLNNGTAEEAIRACVDGGKLGWHTENGIVVLTSREFSDSREAEAKLRESNRRLRLAEEADLLSRMVGFGGENLAIRDVAEMLGRALGVPVQVDPETWSRAARFTFEEGSRPASEVVGLLRKGAPLIVSYRDGTLWFLSPDGIK